MASFTKLFPKAIIILLGLQVGKRELWGKENEGRVWS
jgi:hypothetical protein